MKIEGSHTIKAPRELVYRLMVDPKFLQRCVPGCQSLEAVGDDAYKMTLKAGVGSIKGVFTGSIKLDEMREPEHYKMIVDAKGSPGFLKGEGLIDLVEQDDETKISFIGRCQCRGDHRRCGTAYGSIFRQDDDRAVFRRHRSRVTRDPQSRRER